MGDNNVDGDGVNSMETAVEAIASMEMASGALPRPDKVSE
jgi:hypothetical protein